MWVILVRQFMWKSMLLAQFLVQCAQTRSQCIRRMEVLSHLSSVTLDVSWAVLMVQSARFFYVIVSS